jgi:ATP-binding cassette subfamily B protein
VLRRLAYLWPFLKPHRKKLGFGMLAILFGVAVGMVGPLLVGAAIDAVRRGATSGQLALFCAAVVGVSLVQGTFSYTQRMLLVGMSRDIEFDLRNAYFAALERQPPSFFVDRSTGDLMARATNDISAVRMLCGPAIMYFSNTVFTGGGALFFMARINFRLMALALITMPLVAVATNFFGRRIHRLFSTVQERFSDVTAKAQEALAGARVVRAYAREEREIADFGRVNDQYLESNRRLIGWTVAFHPLLQALVGLGFVAVLWYGGLLTLHGAISIGEFVTFQIFLTKLVWPMIALGWVVNLAQRGTASVVRIQEILDVVPAIRDQEPVVEPDELHGAVSFRHLTFSYKEGLAPVLSEIDFQVAAGTTVAVVGRTGSGKSTLLALLPRLLDPAPGTLFLDGADVRNLALARLRGAIGMVPQETFLFSTTIRDNVALGRPEASDGEVREAARLAGLEPDLAAFPAGLDTVVGERGITLSGGQKQRVALARALLRDPRLLLLDDCLSAVDTQTEEAILRNLRLVFKGRTVFLVSHRVSTVKDADLILVLDHGRIAERGSHAQLLAHGGLYADLHQRQLLEEELAAV